MQSNGIAILTIIALVAPVLAFADTPGTPGRLASLRQAGPASDLFGQRRGSIVVDEGKGVLSTYVWGGSNCPNAELPDSLLMQLSSVLGNPKLRIIPIYKLGQGGSLCLVQVLTPEKKYVDDIVP